jgi:hypothetical protein
MFAKLHQLHPLKNFFHELRGLVVHTATVILELAR